jgi:hypothetical protein
MKRLLQTLQRAILSPLRGLRGDQVYRTRRSEELPASLKSRTLYVLGSPKPWSVALLCPCGCQKTIQLSLLENDSPSWQLRLGPKGQPTLEPSIWRTNGCRSHFFMRNGKIVWCRPQNRRN